MTAGWALAALAAGRGVAALAGGRGRGTAVPVAALALLHGWWGVAGLAAAAALVGPGLTRLGASPTRHGMRRAVSRFWFQVGLLRQAGLAWLQAVEGAAAAVPEAGEAVREAVAALAGGGGRAADDWAARLGGPEAPMVLAMLRHAFRHGLDAEVVFAQAAAMEEGLDFEESVARRGRQPLWLAVLPALLLFNVVILFGLPMVLSAGRSWPYRP